MKKLNWMNQAFPPPNYLRMPAVGVDISDLSIKFAELKYVQGVLKLGRFGQQAIPAGAIEGGVIKQKEKVIEALRLLREKHKLNYAVISLPEEQAYIVRLSLPAISRRELRQSIELQLEEYVPLAGSEMVFDYEIIQDHGPVVDKMEVNVSVLPKDMVNNYSLVLKSANWQVLAFEIEAQALARSLLNNHSRQVSLIVDIGKTRTSFAITQGSAVSFTSTIDHIGGKYITKSIAKSLNLELAQAEKLKINKGLLLSADNQPLFEALMPLISVLKDEISNILKYWRTHQPIGSELVSQVVLCGGQSTLPGLDDYLTANLELPVLVGNPWRNILSTNEIIPPIKRHDALRYSTALGLALRSIN